MVRTICEVNAQSKEEALLALEYLRQEVEKIPRDQHLEPVHFIATAVVFSPTSL